MNTKVHTSITITSEESFGDCIYLKPTWIVSINGRDYEVKKSYSDRIEVFPYGGDDEPASYRHSLPPIEIEWTDIRTIDIH